MLPNYTPEILCQRYVRGGLMYPLSMAPEGNCPVSDISEKLLPYVKLLPGDSIIIQCLHPQLRGSQSKPFQIQCCVFIKVNLLFSPSTGLSDLLRRLTISTSGGGGSGGRNVKDKTKKTRAPKRSDRSSLGLRKAETQKQKGTSSPQGLPVSSYL